MQLRDYLGGNDWWREVLHFYIGLVGKPKEVTDWIISKVTVLSYVEGETDERLTPPFPLLSCMQSRHILDNGILFNDGTQSGTSSARRLFNLTLIA